ncbi:MAG: aminotransferase class I/II-fold pyridoxal phosphate-dependent enzyme [Planctomycetota bacterium]
MATPSSSARPPTGRDRGRAVLPERLPGQPRVVTALAGPGDTILSDALVHASLIDAARLSRARVLVHRHLDLGDLEAGLAASRSARRRLVLTEGVFGMDGDRPDLAALAELCARHDAVLVVDEAHAAGLCGPGGAGAWPDSGAGGATCVRVVTGGKALGAAGGLVVGSRPLCALLANRARSFVFTTAAPPAVAAGLRAAIGIVRGDAALRARPRARATRLARALGLGEPAAAIVPFVVGGEDEAMAAAAALGDRFDVRAVRPPTVPAGTSRLRLVCHAHNTEP